MPNSPTILFNIMLFAILGWLIYLVVTVPRNKSKNMKNLNIILVLIVSFFVMFMIIPKNNSTETVIDNNTEFIIFYDNSGDEIENIDVIVTPIIEKTDLNIKFQPIDPDLKIKYQIDNTPTIIQYDNLTEIKRIDGKIEQIKYETFLTK